MPPKRVNQSSSSLIKILFTQQRNEQEIQTLLNVFQKSMGWLEEYLDKQSLKDAVSKISIYKGAIKQKIGWIYVIEGHCIYHQMLYTASEFIRFTYFQAEAVIYQENGLYAFLTIEDLEQIKNKHKQRSDLRICKFIRKNIFYSNYLETQLIKQFCYSLQTENLSYNTTLNWKDEDKSIKIAIIYQGVISIQHHWKRNIQISEITKGMFLINQVQLDQKRDIDPKKRKDQLKQSSKFKYVSKSDETILLIFNADVFNQISYNAYSHILSNIKDQYRKYNQLLKVRISFDQQIQSYRKKQSIKRDLKKYQTQRIMLDSTLKLQTDRIMNNSIPKLYSSISLNQSPPGIFKNESKNYPNLKQLSSSLIAIPKSRKNKWIKSNSSLLNNHHSTKAPIHNSWIEGLNKKPKNVKSFSTLQSTSIYQQQIYKRNLAVKESAKQKKQPIFFIPDQFVKKKLKIQYQDIISKIKNLDLTLKQEPEQSVMKRIRKLQEEVDSKRIVKLNNAKKKHMFLRDKVQY